MGPKSSQHRVLSVEQVTPRGWSTWGFSFFIQMAATAYIDPEHLCTHPGCRHPAKPRHWIEGFVPSKTLWNLQTPGLEKEKAFQTAPLRILYHFFNHFLISHHGRAVDCHNGHVLFPKSWVWEGIGEVGREADKGVCNRGMRWELVAMFV